MATDRPPRVAVYRRTFTALSETFIYDSVVELQRQGVECYVVAEELCNLETRPYERVIWAHPSGSRLLFAANLRLFNQSAWYRGSCPHVGLVAQYWFFLRRRIVAALRKLRPDVIHVHFGTDGIMMAPIAKALNIPLVVTFHGYDATQREVLARYKLQYRELFESASAIVGVSDFICDQLASLGASHEKLICIRTGTDVDRYEYSNPVERFDGTHVRLLHVGRFVGKKSPIELIQSVALARQRLQCNGIELALDMIGDGPLMHDARTLVSNLELQDSIHLHGSLPRDDVTAHFQRAHIYTQHSVTEPDGNSEGLPVSLMEAAASGLPIVSTRHSGIPELVIDGTTGYLVSEHDVSAMADRIVALARNPTFWTHFGCEGRRVVQSRFSLQTETKKLAAIYESVSRRAF